MNTNSAKPVRKVASAGVAGAAATVLVWVATTFFHTELSADVTAAIVTLVMFAAAYLTPSEQPA
jgi:hypothetical protein